jgi:hypothetical protein
VNPNDRVSHILLFLCLVIAPAMAVGNKAWNEDLFLGFCAGREILQGRLAQPDMWSYTWGGHIWVDQSWLSHLTYYSSYIKLGDIGPVLVQVSLLILGAAALYAQSRRLGASIGWSMTATVIGLLAITPFLGIRSENFGMLYFILVLGALAAPVSTGTWSQISILLLLVLWGNSHGSFMLGMLMLAARVAIIFIQAVAISRKLTLPSIKGFWQDTLNWALCLVLSVIGVAYVNPYGYENLAIPFRQLGATNVTQRWSDWAPLIIPGRFWDYGVFKALSGVPFESVMSLALVLTVVLIIAHFVGHKNKLNLLRTDFLVHFAAIALTIPLAFKFRRMILFAAPALVPILAILINNAVELIEERSRLRGFSVKTGFLSVFFSILLFLALGAAFYKATILPRVPWNPLLHSDSNQSLAGSFMSHDMIWRNASDFLKNNEIEGRLFANAAPSNYVLFNNPSMKLFFDLRAQSFYPSDIINHYIRFFSSASGAEADGILSRYNTEIVFLDTTSDVGSDEGVNLVAGLTGTKNWVCVYKDNWIYILAKKDFLPISGDGSLPFRYPDQETKIISEGFYHYYSFGSVPESMLESFKGAVKARPDPAAYKLALQYSGEPQCLTTSAKEFVEAAAQDLSKRNFLTPGGGPVYLHSLWTLLDILEQDAGKCGNKARSQKLSHEMNRVRQIFAGLRAKYDGF